MIRRFRSRSSSSESREIDRNRAITTFRAEWDWSRIDRNSFLRLLMNHGVWHERHSDADSPHASLWTLLEIHRKQLVTS